MEDHREAEQDQHEARHEARNARDAAYAHGPRDNEPSALVEVGAILQQAQAQTAIIEAEVEVIEDALDDLAEGEGHDGEIVAVEAQHGNPDQKAHDGGKERADHQRQRETQGSARHKLLKRDGGGYAREGADAHEARVTEAELTQHADGEVQRERHHDIGTDRNEHSLERGGDTARRDHAL